MTVPISETLAKAEPEMLKEILREAESYLGAQLTAALAANQRAMIFMAVISAATAVIGGAAGSLLLSGGGRLPLGVICVAVACGLLIAVWTAMASAAPSAFGYVGNVPSQWVDDVEARLPLQDSLAQQCAHYEEKISENRERMDSANKKIERAIKMAFWTMVGGGVAAISAIIIERVLIEPLALYV